MFRYIEGFISYDAAGEVGTPTHGQDTESKFSQNSGVMARMMQEVGPPSTGSSSNAGGGEPRKKVVINYADYAKQ